MLPPTSSILPNQCSETTFPMQKARPDIHTAVAFLTKRITSPDVDVYGKLRRVVRYLRATAELPLTLESDPLGMVQWWVDASFAVHPHMKNHTGAIMSLGKGAVFSMLTRQKLIRRARRKLNWLGLTTLFDKSCGPAISCKLKVSMLVTTSSIKISTVPSCWRGTAGDLVVNGRDTSTSVTSS